MTYTTSVPTTRVNAYVDTRLSNISYLVSTLVTVNPSRVVLLTFVDSHAESNGCDDDALVGIHEAQLHPLTLL